MPIKIIMMIVDREGILKSIEVTASGQQREGVRRKATMAKFNVVDMNGQHVSEIELSDAVFGITPNEKEMCIRDSCNP